MATGLHAPEPEFSRNIEIGRIGDAPVNFSAEATPEECAAVAARLDVLGVHRLSFDAILSWNARRKLIEISGTVHALLQQTCVVSLEPMDVKVDASFARLYTPGAAGPQDKAGAEFAADEEDPPEPVQDGRIDLGEAAVEQLLLSIDLYPRKPDAEIPEAYAAEAQRGDDEHPFAALRRLTQTH